MAPRPRLKRQGKPNEYAWFASLSRCRGRWGFVEERERAQGRRGCKEEDPGGTPRTEEIHGPIGSYDIYLHINALYFLIYPTSP
jgi:hypothetical protein